MTNLRAHLDRATDLVDSPKVVTTALRNARRRRARRRGTAAAGLTAVVVVGVVVAIHTVGGPAVRPPDPATPNPSRTSGGDPEQRNWDPRGVDDLPEAPADVAPALPEVIEPPATSPALADDRTAAVVLAVEQRGGVQLLGTDGTWRTVPVDAPDPIVSVSPEGTRVGVYYYADSSRGITVHDTATGETRQIPYPEDYRPWDFTRWTFTDEETLLLDDREGGFLVGAVTGDAERVPYPDDDIGSGIGPEGAVVTMADYGSDDVFTDWANGSPREVSTQRTGRFTGPIGVSEDAVAGINYEGRPLIVVVADRATLTPQAVLAVEDRQGVYFNGGLRVLAVGDDGSVICSVTAAGRRLPGSRVVSWHPVTGRISRVSAVPLDAAVVSYAADLLRVTG